MNTLFELAPRSRIHEWDKALAFAIAPAAPAFAAIYLFADDLVLAAIVSVACFVGVAICAFVISSTPLGRLAIADGALVLDSGFLHVRVPLAELDLAAARPGATPDADLRLATRAENAVTIPRRAGGPALVVTPLDREAFLATLKSLPA